MVKLLEQYTTKLLPEEHQKMQEAVQWLYENGFLKETNKYKVTKYALETLIGIVENKKKKLEEDLKTVKEKEPEKISEEKTPKKLSSGGQSA